MKNLKLALGVLFVSMLFTRCTPDQLMPSSTKELIVQGNWAVNYYYNGQDNTAQYQGLTFRFNGGGSVTATSGTASYSGTWNTINDASRNEVLILHIDGSQSLAALDAQWTVGNASTATIGLKNSTSTQMVLKKQ